jgi:AAA domain
MRDLASIASALGGKVTGQGVFAPGPNNSHLAVFLDSTNADGVRVSPEQYTYYVLSKVGSNGATKAAVANFVKMRTKSKTAPAEIDPQQPLLWADTSTWDSTPCPPREWAVRDRIPLRQVTLFSGEGAIGKSIVEMMLCVAHVLGKDWLGSLPDPGGAFYFGCEDDEPELRIRFHGIAAHYGSGFPHPPTPDAAQRQEPNS